MKLEIKERLKVYTAVVVQWQATLQLADELGREDLAQELRDDISDLLSWMRFITDSVR